MFRLVCKQMIQQIFSVQFCICFQIELMFKKIVAHKLKVRLGRHDVEATSVSANQYKITSTLLKL